MIYVIKSEENYQWFEMVYMIVSKWRNQTLIAYSSSKNRRSSPKRQPWASGPVLCMTSGTSPCTRASCSWSGTSTSVACSPGRSPRKTSSLHYHYVHQQPSGPLYLIEYILRQLLLTTTTIRSCVQNREYGVVYIFLKYSVISVTLLQEDKCLTLAGASQHHVLIHSIVWIWQSATSIDSKYSLDDAEVYQRLLWLTSDFSPIFS